MLLPSALTCDTSPAPPQTTKLHASSTLFASPPLSPPPSSTTYTAITNIYSTCRALQSMLSPAPMLSQLPSPPLAHALAPSSAIKLRLRQRRDETPTNLTQKKITKRNTVQVPRGINKRRRAVDDEMRRETVELDSGGEDENCQPSTPKRIRLAPESLPLGLERSDFHNLHLQNMPSTPSSSSLLPSMEDSRAEGEKGQEWSTEEDRLLVELVLEKLKLSKSEWQDCARSLGKDRGSVGKRWKSLMSSGDVGLKRSRRAKLHGSWR